MTYEELVKKAIEQQNSLLISNPEESFVRFGKRKLDMLSTEEAFEQISKRYPTYLQSISDPDKFLAWKDDKKTKELENKKAFDPQKEVNDAHNATEADENMLQVWNGTYNPTDTPNAHLWKDPEWRGQNIRRGSEAAWGAAKQGLYYTIPSLWGLSTMMWDQTLQAYTDPDKIARIKGGSGMTIGNINLADDWINQPEQEELHNFLAEYGYTMYGSASLGRNDVIPAGYWLTQAWDAGITSSLAKRKDPVGWIRGKASKDIMAGKEVFNRAGEHGFRPPSDLVFLPELYPEQQSEDFKKAFQEKYGKSFEEYVDPHIQVFESKYETDNPEEAPRGVNKHRSNTLDPMTYLMDLYENLDGQPSPWEEGYDRHKDPFFQVLANRTQRSFEHWDKKLLDSYEGDTNMLAMMEWQQAEPFDLFSEDVKDWDMLVRDTGMMGGSMIAMIVASKVPKVGGLIGSKGKQGFQAMRSSFNTSVTTQAANRNFFKQSLDTYMKNRKIVPPPGYIDNAAKLTDIITPFGMAAVEGSSTFKAQYDLMLQQGWTPDDAILGASYLAVMYTPGSVLLERYGLRRIGGVLGFADDAMEQSFMRGMKRKAFNGFLKNSPLGQGLATVGIDGLQLTATVLQEGWTEGMQETWNMLGEKAILEGYGTNHEAALANVIRQMKDEGIQIVDVWGVGKQLGLSDREVDPQISSAAGSATISTIPLTLAGMSGKAVNNMKQVHKNYKFRTYTKEAYEKGGRVEVVVSEQEEKGFDQNGLPTSLYTVQTIEYDSQGNPVRVISEDRDIRGADLAENRRKNIEKDINEFRQASDEDIQNQANKEAADVDAQKAEPTPEAPASPEVQTARAISTEYDTGGEIVAPGDGPVEQKAKEFVDEIGGVEEIESMVSEGSLSRSQADNIIDLAEEFDTDPTTINARADKLEKIQKDRPLTMDEVRELAPLEKEADEKFDEAHNQWLDELDAAAEEGIKDPRRNSIPVIQAEIAKDEARLEWDRIKRIGYGPREATTLDGNIITRETDLNEVSIEDQVVKLGLEDRQRNIEYIAELKKRLEKIKAKEAAVDLDKKLRDEGRERKDLGIVDDPVDVTMQDQMDSVSKMSNTDLNKYQKELGLDFTAKDISTNRDLVEEKVMDIILKPAVDVEYERYGRDYIDEPDTLEPLGIPEVEIEAPKKEPEGISLAAFDALEDQLINEGIDMEDIQNNVYGNNHPALMNASGRLNAYNNLIEFADKRGKGQAIRDAIKFEPEYQAFLDKQEAPGEKEAEDIEAKLKLVEELDVELEKEDVTSEEYLQNLEAKQFILESLPKDAAVEIEAKEVTKEEKKAKKVANDIVDDIEGCL